MRSAAARPALAPSMAGTVTGAVTTATGNIQQNIQHMPAPIAHSRAVMLGVSSVVEGAILL